MKKNKWLFRIPLLSVVFLPLFSVIVLAGPPKDARTVMRPFRSICTPTFESILGALVKDYAVHISITFDENPLTQVVVVENPDTAVMAIIHIAQNGTACLVFSGKNVQRFERPGDMAPPEVDIHDLGEKDTEA